MGSIQSDKTRNFEMEKLPIPAHLSKIMIPVGENDEFEVTGLIKCMCGSDEFIVNYAGDNSEFTREKVIRTEEIEGLHCLIINAACSKCGKEHLIFDNHLHGWNGYVCHNDEYNKFKTRTVNLWKCPKCSDNKNRIRIKISSQGIADFIEEAGDRFRKSEWVDGFEWINIDLNCSNCNSEYNDWINYETM